VPHTGTAGKAVVPSRFISSHPRDTSPRRPCAPTRALRRPIVRLDRAYWGRTHASSATGTNATCRRSTARPAPPMSVARARRNGGTCPPHPAQFLSWALFLLFVASFYALFVVYPPTLGGRVAAGVLFGLAAVFTFAFAAAATAINPADERIYQPSSRSPREFVSGLLYCYRCERHVLSSSKHCTICQKCVDVFDHHCIWLNNCVGKRNYVEFFLLLICAACMLAIQACVGVYVLSDYVDTSEGGGRAVLEARVAALYPSFALGAQGYFAAVMTISVLAVIGVGAVVQLFAFHASLSA
jgi:hypothetical protein